MFENHPMGLLFTDIETNQQLDLKHQNLVLGNLFKHLGTPESVLSKAMSLRKVFITHNLDRYEKKRDVFRSNNLDEFLSNLAKQVNTSVDQLTNTYFLRPPVLQDLDSAEEDS